MKGLGRCFFRVPALVLFVVLPASSSEANPLIKVIDLLRELKDHVRTTSEGTENAYQEYKAWCVDVTSREGLEVTAKQNEQYKLEAAVQEATTDISDSQAKIQEIADQLASNDRRLSEATQIRNTENQEFQATEKKLMETIDMLARAISALDKSAKSGSSLAQKSLRSNGLEPILLGLGSVIEAAGVHSSMSTQELTALLQEKEGGDSEEKPKPSNKKSQAVITVMEDMRVKAAKQLESVRAAEAEALHNFKLLKASLEQSSENSNKEMAEMKGQLLQSQEFLAGTEGQLKLVNVALGEAKKGLKSTQLSCITAAADHEKTVKGVQEEIRVLEKTEALLKGVSESSGGYAFVQVKSASSLQQKARATASAKLAAAVSEEALAVIKRVAKQQKSAALTQLADRMTVLTQYKRVGGANPFGKIKQMVSEMLEKLQAELAEEMDEKEWCDFELSKTQESNEDLSDKIEGLKSKLDTAMSTSGQLKEDCKELHSSLANVAKLRKEMDSRRGEQRSSFEALKHDFEQGLNGVQAAISTLRKYYALNEDDASLVQVSSSEDSDQPKPPKRIQKSTGKGAELIGLLEIVEHDIASNIADADSEEEDQAAAYDKVVQENKVRVVELEQDLKYKTGQYTALDKEITEMTNDYSTSSTELEARTEYLKKVQSKCKGAWAHVTFEDRKKKREAEMKGLLEAQAVLQGLEGGGKSESFLQQRPKPATQQQAKQ